VTPVARPVVVLPSLDLLTDATALSRVLDCEVVEVVVEPLAGVGFSSAALQRVELRTSGGERRSLVLKHTRLNQDWTARLTGDSRGREAQLITEPRLAGVWDVFASPYLACAVDSDAAESGLLMSDLTPSLLPDVRAPLGDDQEADILGALARLHAAFWDTAASSSFEWLVHPAQYCDVLAPCAADNGALDVLSPMLRDAVPRGWMTALARLPPAVARHMTRPGSEWERHWRDVPLTVVHGDAKIANFACLGDHRVAAFDWALAGLAPCTTDIGWYLAVNASRLTTSKEDTLRRYRALLETARGAGVPDRLWSQLEDIAVITGARMLLWSKALALESGRAGAADEWEWWCDRLSAVRVH
jgi:hypothetical protein